VRYRAPGDHKAWRGIRSSGKLTTTIRFAKTWQGVDADSRTPGSLSKRERPTTRTLRLVQRQRLRLPVETLALAQKAAAGAVAKPATPADVRRPEDVSGLVN
jgi:hypothetical protein